MSLQLSLLLSPETVITQARFVKVSSNVCGLYNNGGRVEVFLRLKERTAQDLNF